MQSNFVLNLADRNRGFFKTNTDGKNNFFTKKQNSSEGNIGDEIYKKVISEVKENMKKIRK